MTTSPNYRPPGFHSITPYLTVPDGNAELRFLASAFGARELSVHREESGALRHAEIQIGDSILEMSQGSEQYPARPCNLHLYVEDSLATIERAVAAGGKLQYEPGLRFYGDREGGVEDPAGNTWWIATREEHLSEEEMDRRTREQMKKS
jgi:PhnB protein